MFTSNCSCCGFLIINMITCVDLGVNKLVLQSEGTVLFNIW